MLPRKRPSKSNKPFLPPFVQPNELPKPAVAAAAAEPKSTAHLPNPNGTSVDKMATVLADAGCPLSSNSTGPLYLSSHPYAFRRRLDGKFSQDSTLRSEFLKGFSDYIASAKNLRRVLLPCYHEGSGAGKSDSLVRLLLLVESIQQDLQDTLLEKLPQYFDMGALDESCRFTNSSRLDEDIARLILNQFRWLDFLVDSDAFAEKLLQVLSICPHHLKIEIIGSLPEIFGDQNNSTVVSSLQQILQEDSSIIVPVLDCFSNLNLDDLLQDQAIMIALSCIRTINAEHMPYLLKFLLLSAKASNAGRIISKIREELKFVGGSYKETSQHSKLKGKSIVDNAEASILDALRSSLRFRKVLCQDILNELKSLKEARNHKVIDIWLLTFIYMNNESLQKSAEKLLKKKVLEGCIQEHMFDQCIRAIKDLSKDYLPTFLSLSAFLLACKEQRAQEFGVHLYVYLFEEFCDRYSRQEILGALLTHVGSGMGYEVGAALDALVKLATKKYQELISLSAHINSLLDYLEGFSVESLHKVYEVFTILAVSALSGSQPYGCSIANDVLMILRKQVNSPDLIYKKMGLIGSLKMVSCLTDTNNTSVPPLSQRTNNEEALELLKVSLDSCKQLPLALILFHEELVSTLESKTLHPLIMEWVGKHVAEFESIYLSDLGGGILLSQDSSCGLEGELWMNLDGDISPICLNIMQLVTKSFRSASLLQVLPTKFVLLSVVERLTNQGSLGGIDALLGCPIHLPSSKLFSESSWESLTAKQKQIAILSLYYAANWIRELLNAFSSQVVEECDIISQATKEEIVMKLLKRLRNLIFVEYLLNNCLKLHPLLLPELYPRMESFPLTEVDSTGNMGKMSPRIKGTESTSNSKKRNKRKLSSQLADSNIEGNSLKQPKIVDIWRKAGVLTSQEAANKNLLSNTTQLDSTGNQAKIFDLPQNIEITLPAKFLDAQMYKFRPLSVDCLSVLARLKNQNNEGSCCADSSAEFPLHVYLLRDINKKLDYLSPTRKQISARWSNASAGFGRMKSTDSLRKIESSFPYIRKNFDRAVLFLTEGVETCEVHWSTHSSLAANPEIISTIISAKATDSLSSVFKETIRCFGKIINLPDVLKEKGILSGILRAFQPMETSNFLSQVANLNLSPGNVDYLYVGAFIFLGDVYDVAISCSFTLASEVLLTLEFMISSINMFLNGSEHENEKDTCTGISKGILPFFSNKLGSYAKKLLMQKCDWDDTADSYKNKGEVIQRILRIYLENCHSSLDLLNEIACSVLPQVSASGASSEVDNKSFPTLSQGTFIIWYRVMHEENLSNLSNLVKEIGLLRKPNGEAQVEKRQNLLDKVSVSVNVVVSLINLCRTKDKVSIRALAVKYGGKFMDTFLKVFDFLQDQFQTHMELIKQLFKELQKATRTIQTICSEAKGSKQTAVAVKVPACKRSMERFVFRVKALLHITNSGCSFWIGNLKHKDLMGQVVSSQAYLDDADDDDNNDDPAEIIFDDQPTDVAS